ncbi:hypothetical protein [Leclercia sp.]|nr:hypothetical protein [Leclercia sp.]
MDTATMLSVVDKPAEIKLRIISGVITSQALQQLRYEQLSADVSANFRQ